uniref:Cellulose synthase-like protein D3 n=1 Tax=Ananas comosus var. bracteatus TaxID=296719 RepID=A0A6V7PJP8_ANACO|nr:unnamed protein product [Ananas comosus var. bracteatus]
MIKRVAPWHRTARFEIADRPAWLHRPPIRFRAAVAPLRPSGPTVKFARRTQSGRYVSYSRDDLDSEIGSGEFSQEFTNYHVHIPATPDNQPMEVSIDPSISAKVEEQYVSNSLFTGGFNSVTRAHLMDKVIESEASHPQMAGAKGSSCSIQGCDSKVMSDERGIDILPCECDFKICAECFGDAVKAGGICPGCKEPYKTTELDDIVNDSSTGAQPHLSLPRRPRVCQGWRDGCQ